MTTRRKSSFFCNKLSEIINVSDSPSKNSSFEEQIILNHVSLMKAEITEWKKTLRRVESAHKESINSRERGIILTASRVREYLTPEDLDFFESRPDLLALTSALKNVSQLLHITKHRVNRLGNKVNMCVEITSDVDADMKRQICLYLLLCDESADLF